MKKKLLELDLPENVADAILDVFQDYQKTLETYSKPAGPKAFANHLRSVETISKELSDRLKKLTAFERQILAHSGAGNVRALAIQMAQLSTICSYAKGKDVQGSFSKKEPFLKQLGIEIKEVLENHGIPVTVYEGNIFCNVIDILLDQKAGSKSFTLLRKISNPS